MHIKRRFVQPWVGIVLNFYIPGTIRTRTPEGTALRLNIATEYPADGAVRIAVMPEQEETFSLALRIPGWCKAASLWVNGEEEAVVCGYHTLTRRWKAGDTIQLRFEMETCGDPAGSLRPGYG